MGVVDFNGEMYSALREGEEQGRVPLESANYQFPLWDILKEIDRRTRRAGRDKGGQVREYIREHPEAAEEVRRKHGL